MGFLNLEIVEMPATIYGIYGANKDQMPKRARWLHPAAAESFNRMNAEKRVRVSDVLRSAESSLEARKAGRGAQQPGFSGHNFGFSIDIDVTWMLKNHKLDKKGLDDWMQSHGWHCFLKDHSSNREEWHYNFYGPEAADLVRDSERTNQDSLERKIVNHYGAAFTLTDVELQDALKRLGFYSGEIDGDIGPISRAAIGAFQRAWTLHEYFRSKAEYDADRAGPVTRRVLAFVEAERTRAGAIKASTITP